MSSPAPILDTSRAGILASQDYRDLIADLKDRHHFLVGKKEPGLAFSYAAVNRALF
jgi:hypothetical protein